MKKTYEVSRSVNYTEYCEVKANSEEEAISKAKKLSNDKWSQNSNDEYLDYYLYNAEEID